MIYLGTGKPGAGKTAWALVQAFKLKKEGRTVYAHGVPELDYEKCGFHKLDDPTKWEDLPDGSVVLIDECYTVFPSRAAGRAVPSHVEALARHRHRGFDFILICQQGLQLDSFLRGLVEEHVHLEKRFGTRATKLKRWSAYQGATSAKCMDTEDWIRPKWVFEHYKSTTMDTTRVRIPRWLVILLGLVVLVVGGTYYAKARWEAKVEAMKAEGSTARDSRGTSGAGAGVPAAVTYKNADDYLAAMQPRVEYIPASAPIYDGRQVKQYPRAYCVASGFDGEDGCTCYTQQVTRLAVHPQTCQKLAKEGGVFDPYLEPLDSGNVRASKGGPESSVGDFQLMEPLGSARAPQAARGATTAEQVASYGQVAAWR